MSEWEEVGEILEEIADMELYPSLDYTYVGWEAVAYGKGDSVYSERSESPLEAVESLLKYVKIEYPNKAGLSRKSGNYDNTILYELDNIIRAYEIFDGRIKEQLKKRMDELLEILGFNSMYNYLQYMEDIKHGDN